jgi:hypothetical protein
MVHSSALPMSPKIQNNVSAKKSPVNKLAFSITSSGTVQKSKSPLPVTSPKPIVRVDVGVPVERRSPTGMSDVIVNNDVTNDDVTVTVLSLKAKFEQSSPEAATKGRVLNANNLNKK